MRAFKSSFANLRSNCVQGFAKCLIPFLGLTLFGLKILPEYLQRVRLCFYCDLLYVILFLLSSYFQNTKNEIFLPQWKVSKITLMLNSARKSNKVCFECMYVCMYVCSISLFPKIPLGDPLSVVFTTNKRLKIPIMPNNEKSRCLQTF